jgi:ketosteroid isomerase-like protein
VETNVQVIQRILGCMGSGDPISAVQALLDVCDPDVVLIEPDALPYGGTYHGPNALLEVLAQMAAFVPDMTQTTVETVIGAGDDVVVRMRMPWLAPGAEEVTEMPICEWWRFRDGKVVEIRPFLFDTAKAAGLTPVRPS